MDGHLKNTSTELQFYKTSTWLLGPCGGRRCGGRDERKLRKWIKYFSCLEEIKYTYLNIYLKIYIFEYIFENTHLNIILKYKIKKLWEMNKNIVNRM